MEGYIVNMWDGKSELLMENARSVAKESNEIVKERR